MKKTITLALFALLGSHKAAAEQFDHHIALNQTSAATFYIDGNIKGYGSVSMLVDTGSTYSAIDENTLSKLQAGGNATYLKSLNGVMANGSRLEVSVYRISGITLGGQCTIRDVEAAVFPGQTRPILGLSALHKVSPFIFSTDPPGLALSNCVSELADAGTVKSEKLRPVQTVQPSATAPAAEVALVGEGPEAAQTPK
jgi:predicted aspartyl protease